ncbi:hypothetical protein PXO_04875 [Xanthomonas oryzae pv. oryzae PXO99A]|uniref:Uncharacterized protein n=1 Tax=Xanthomonas oryzae pv. oryzae (strain PXO99A) TaxID=360094 RepID=A0A0K0GIV1_XANOP|nr:hypothetical protein PXO_04875 [Xanthomonas oryzae pv. oryzae PXO99A]
MANTVSGLVHRSPLAVAGGWASLHAPRGLRHRRKKKEALRPLLVMRCA